MGHKHMGQSDMSLPWSVDARGLQLRFSDGNWQPSIFPRRGCVYGWPDYIVFEDNDRQLRLTS